MSKEGGVQLMKENTEVDIDLLAILKLLWSRLWIIVLSMIVCGAIAFSSAIFLIPQKYTATATMYVNNSSLSVNGGSITFSSSQISAAKSLLDVYVIILKSRTTLNEVIDRADLNVSYSQLRSMISAGSVNGTEVFSISATTTDAKEAEVIVNTIVDILPTKISYIVEGSSVKTIDTAVVPASSSSPSYTKYAMLGFIVGAALSAFVIVVEDLLNTSVRDEEYLKSRYDLPVLAVIPEMYDVDDEGHAKKFGYKRGYKNLYKYRYKYKYNAYDYYRCVSENESANAQNTEQKDGAGK